MDYFLIAITSVFYLLINSIYWLMGYQAGWRWLVFVSIFLLPAACYLLYLIGLRKGLDYYLIGIGIVPLGYLGGAL